jgi:hypothetical protein
LKEPFPKQIKSEEIIKDSKNRRSISTFELQMTQKMPKSEEGDSSTSSTEKK